MRKIKSITPMFTGVLVTANMYVQPEEGLLGDNKNNALDEFQEVVAVGNAVRNVKVGDVVKVNPSRYAIKKHQEGSLKDGVISDNVTVGYNFNLVEMNDNVYLYLQESDIDYIVEFE